MNAVIFFLLGLSSLYLILLTLMTLIYRPGRKRFIKPTDFPVQSDYPLVSILKPVKRFDDDPEANLESFHHLDYPAYEILIAVDSWQDREVEIIKKVADRHPEIFTRVIVT